MSPELAAQVSRRDHRLASLLALRKAAAMVHSVGGLELAVTRHEEVFARVSHRATPGCPVAMRACAFRQAVVAARLAHDPYIALKRCGLRGDGTFGLHLYGSEQATVCPPGVVAVQTDDGDVWVFPTVLDLHLLAPMAVGFDVQVRRDDGLDIALVVGRSPVTVELAMRCAAAEVTQVLPDLP